MRVIVIRFSSLGDCVLLCPLLSHLKAGGAEEVTVVTKTAYAELFAHADGADRVVAFDPGTGVGGLVRIARDLRGDDTVVIDAHNNWRSRFLAWRLGGADARFNKHYRERLGLIVFKQPMEIPTILEQYGRLGVAAGMEPAHAVPGGLTVGETARERVLLQLTTTQPMVAVAPGSRWATKRWSTERFLELSDALASTHGYHVVLVGDPQDAEFARPIADALGARCTDATARTSIMETAAWIARCRGFVGNDSGLMHLAEAVGVPVVGIFGPTVREFGYFPTLDASKTVERTLSCRPCTRNGARPCPRHTQVCMDIEPGAVESAVVDMLERRGERRHVVQKEDR